MPNMRWSRSKRRFLYRSLAVTPAQERFEKLKEKYRHHSMHPDPIVWQEFHDLISLVEASVETIAILRTCSEEEAWRDLEQRMKK